MICALRAIVHSDPDAIRSIIHPLTAADGSVYAYEVTLYDGSTQKVYTVYLSDVLAAEHSASFGNVINGLNEQLGMAVMKRKTLGGDTFEVWAKVLELAIGMALADQQGGIPAPGDAYALLGSKLGGYTTDAFRLVLGPGNFGSGSFAQDAASIDVDARRLQSMLAAGQQVTVSTNRGEASLKAPYMTGTQLSNEHPLIGHHAYLVKRVFQDDDNIWRVELENPWNGQTTIVPFSFLENPNLFSYAYTFIYPAEN